MDNRPKPSFLDSIRMVHDLRHVYRPTRSAIDERKAINEHEYNEQKKFASFVSAHGASDITIYGTTKGGANFVLCEPQIWNGGLLIYCHGHRAQGHGLIAELDLKGTCYQELLKEGWMIAGTSYRRTGVVIKDSQEDVLELREFICRRYSLPRLVLLEGQSMGGAIATLMAERYPELVHGVLAVGAALNWRRDKMSNEEETKIELLHTPLVPVLFLTNESELSPVKQYISKTLESGADVIRPALWEVSRPGHNWTNQLERLSAIKYLIKWIKFGTFITCREKNNTYQPIPSSSIPTFDEKRGIGKVVHVTVHNSFVINFTPNHLRTLGIRKRGTKFNLTVVTDGRKFTSEVNFDQYPFVHSKRGELIAFAEPDHDNIVISIHNVQGLHRSVFVMGRVMVGDRVLIPFLKQKRRMGKVRIPKGLLSKPMKELRKRDGKV